MGLRVRDGIDAANFRARAGVGLETVIDPIVSKRLADAELIVHDADGLRATAAGRQRLDAVIAALFA